MKKLIAPLLLSIILPANVQADPISTDNRGTWTRSGQCQDAQRIVIAKDNVTLMDGAKKKVLREAEESVWNGTRLINAAPTNADASDAIAFSASLEERDGEMTLQTKSLGEADKAFDGTYRRCKAETQTASRTRLQKQVSRKPSATPVWPSTLLGGLY